MGRLILVAGGALTFDIVYAVWECHLLTFASFFDSSRWTCMVVVFHFDVIVSVVVFVF